jgi:beta-1,4-N-acetylglucosaminyltransferase
MGPGFKLLLVCSGGGHFCEIKALDPVWRTYDRTWVTFRGPDTEPALRGEKVVWAFHPTNRNLPNFVRNFLLALKVLRAERPGLIVCGGAGVSVPFVYAGRLRGIPSVYIESLTRVRDLSLSGKLVYPFVRHFLVQWPTLAEKHRKAEYRGSLL